MRGIWFFVHFWKATFLQHTPTYHLQREESCWPISCCPIFNKLFAVSGLKKVTQIFILAEMFAVQKQKAGALTYETSIFKQYPKIYVYLIQYCLTMYLITIILLGASAQHTAREYKRQKHTHNQRVYVQQVDPAEMWVHGRFRVSEVTSCICSKDYMKDQVASKLLTGDQAGSSPLVDPRSWIETRSV